MTLGKRVMIFTEDAYEEDRRILFFAFSYTRAPEGSFRKRISDFLSSLSLRGRLDRYARTRKAENEARALGFTILETGVDIDQVAANIIQSEDEIRIWGQPYRLPDGTLVTYHEPGSYGDMAP